MAGINPTIPMMTLNVNRLNDATERLRLSVLNKIPLYAVYMMLQEPWELRTRSRATEMFGKKHLLVRALARQIHIQRLSPEHRKAMRFTHSLQG